MLSPVTRKELKGVVLINSPYNYPFSLTLCPSSAAIAAGNILMLKPLERAPASSTLLAELIPKNLDSELVRFVNGGAAETTKLAFNHTMDNTQCGTVSMNATILIVIAYDAPFGGVSTSGCDYSTGKAFFDEFTHLRSTVDQPNWRGPPFRCLRLTIT